MLVVDKELELDLQSSKVLAVECRIEDLLHTGLTRAERVEVAWNYSSPHTTA